MDPKQLRLDVDSMLEANSSNTNGPFRGKYTRPLGGGSNFTPGGNRYSPYSISRDRPSPRRSVPLIRARRDEDSPAGTSPGSLDLSTSSGFGGNSSSTAQKIIETLASMSTPVLNAGRVRIDSVKSMKPLSLGIGSPVSNTGSVLAPTSRFSGPPKTSSPLLLPKTLSGVRGTSLGTDKFNWNLRSIGIVPKMVDTATNTDESCIIAEKIGQAPTPPTSTQVVPIVANHTPTSTAGKGKKNLVSTAASAVKRKYQLSEPWTIKDVMRFQKNKQRKNQKPKQEPESFPLAASASLSHEYGMTNGEGGVGGKKAKESGGSFSDFKFKPISTPAERMWECGTCMVRNKLSAGKCVCCETVNPDAKKAETSTPDKTDSGIKCSAPAKNWDCPVCMVPNKSTAKVCVCCSEKNPNPVDACETDSKSTTSANAVPTSEFKFGFSNSSASNPTSKPASFSFGSSSSTPATSSSQAGKDFSFGFKSSNSTTTSSPTKTQSSTSATSTASSSSVPFSFGLPSAMNKPMASAAPIKFGLSTSSSEMEKKQEVSPKTIELWECDVCRRKMKFEMHSCDSCGSPRPRELDPNYEKPEEKPKGDLKFEPVFGGLSRSTTQQSSSGGFSSSSTSASGSGFGTSTTFGSGTTFSSGNPFGGGGGAFSGSGTFGASGGTGTFGSGDSGSSNTTTTSAAHLGLFGSSAPPPAYSSPGGSSSSQGFQFGSGSGSPTKRKLDEKEGSETSDPAKKLATTSGVANFSFGSGSAVPALKLKETPTQLFPVAATPGTGASTAPPNNAGFLEALKNASAAVKASSEKQSNTVTSTSGPPAANKMFTFGTPGPTPAGTSTGAGGGFFSDSNSSGFSNTFGSPAAASFSSPSMGLNQTNPPHAVAPVAPVTPAPAATQFNMTTPNTFNFGASVPTPTPTFSFGAPSTGAAGGIAAAPFQFSATPTGGGVVGERKIRKAARRFK